MAQIDLELWEQETFTFGITLPEQIPELPPLPEVPILGISLDFRATCPGHVLCGNPDAATNCSIGKKFAFSFSPDISLPFPPDIALPPMSVTFTFPPKIIIPVSCPNYPSDGQPE